MNVEIISTAVSAFTAVLAIIISIITLKQNNKLIYETNKPDIQIYVDTIMVEHFQKVLVIKNFGKTTATINSLTFSKRLDKVNNLKKLSTMAGATLSPNQSFMSYFQDEYNEKLTATISYSSELDKHQKWKSFNLDFSQTNDLRWVKETDSNLNPESRAIINAALGLIRTIK